MAHMTTGKAAIMSMFCAIGGIFSHIYGGWSNDLATLLMFMGIDFLMGLIVAGVFRRSDKTTGGRIDSRECWQGLCRKGVITLGTTIVRNAAVWAFIANETISIMENAGLMGVPYPEPIKKALEQLQGKINNAEEKR